MNKKKIMKKLFVFLLVVLITLTTKSQVVAIGSEKNFDYGGTLNSEIYKILNENEKCLVDMCFQEAGLKNCDTVWIVDSLIDQMHDDYYSFSRIILNANSTDFKVTRRDEKGTKKRDMSPKCLIFITRQYNESHVKLQVYY